MALFLSEEDVKALLTMPMALAAVEAAHSECAVGQAIDAPRHRTRLPLTVMHMLQGALPSLGVLGFKVYTTNRSGARFNVHLFDAASGMATAVIAADTLGMMRTGAIGGIAAKWLAREDAEIVGVFGAGWQAQSQIEALCAVRPIKQVKVLARNAEKLRAFCERMAQKTGRKVSPAASAEEAVKGSDIVVTITGAATPLFDGEWLMPGAHVTAAGSNSLIRREIDETTVRRAKLVCVDSRAVALKECGDLLPLLEKGYLYAGQLTEIGEVIAGMRPGRGSAQDITLFESHGMAIQDLAVAQHILAIARERGLGSELPY